MQVSLDALKRASEVLGMSAIALFVVSMGFANEGIYDGFSLLSAASAICLMLAVTIWGCVGAATREVDMIAVSSYRDGFSDGQFQMRREATGYRTTRSPVLADPYAEAWWHDDDDW